MDIDFLGATGTVTGSKYLVTSGSHRILVDCGLFQGLKELRRRNWEPLPIRPREIDAVVLTHAHLDHSGYIPLLVKNGFAGRVFCTQATRDLCAILLADSGHIQEDDAEYANRKGFSKHTPALPLYTQADAEAAMLQFSPVAWEHDHPVGNGITAHLSPAGHILGAAIVRIADGDTSILFSGDLGRPHDPTMVAPSSPPDSDYLVVESTYGGHTHEGTDPAVALAGIINKTAARGGVVLVPAFAVGRAQTLLYYVQKLKADGAIPDVPVFLNSPMAANVTDVFCEHRGDHRLSPDDCRATCDVAEIVQSPNESRELNEHRGPMIIISASGMLTGGRVLHHLKAFGSDPRNAIVLAGYQAEGTRGAALARGDQFVRVHGQQLQVRAEVFNMGNLSGHADSGEIVSWLRGCPRAPKRTFITHGERASARALQEQIERELGWTCEVPAYQQRVALMGRGEGATARAPVAMEPPHERDDACPGCRERSTGSEPNRGHAQALIRGPR